ncbi:MAG: cytochrome c peroxidase [Archangium sp.]|nr:cytochrome c peroxidase [Archangium sp.]
MTRVAPFVLVALLGASPAPAAENPDAALLSEAQKLFKPLPRDLATAGFPITTERIALGRVLFFEPRASLDGTVSCARCHLPALYGTDGLARSIGVKDRPNPRNAPTVLNAALQPFAHWRGDRTSVEDQARKALVGPPSFGQPDVESAMKQLDAIPGYRALFQKAFPRDPQPVNADNWASAIGAFERTLVTPSPFDAYLKGKVSALSPSARAGLRSFIQQGCVSCHNGVGIGGASFQKFGLTSDYWKETGSKTADKGRFDVTGNEADAYVFKVASLRNVAMTPPYFHDGSVASLPEAVRVMAKVQLGKDLSPEELTPLVAFLESLTGGVPESFSASPVLPAAGFTAQVR